MEPFTGAALIGAGSAVIGGIWSALEARSNRRFQERMSSTAHTREVADLRRAGLNPMMSMRGGGASTPGGAQGEAPDLARGASTAVQVKMAQKQMELLDAQVDLTTAQAAKTNVEAEDIWVSRTGRLDLTQAQGMVARADAEQRKELLPLLLAKAREEIQLTSSSAEAAKARALLDELAAKGAENIAAFEQRIGEAGPWTRLLFELLRTIRR